MSELCYIIAAHNAGGTLHETLGALLHQRAATAWRAIVVDDASTDSTPAIAEAASTAHRQIRTIKLAARHRGKPSGPAAARRAGLEAATSPWICFLDADDVPTPDHAAAFLERLNSSGADAACAGHRLIDEQGEDLCWSHIPQDGDWLEHKLAVSNRLAVGTVVVARAHLLAAAEQIPELFASGCQSEDWAMWLHLARYAHASGMRWAPVIERPLLAYRQRVTARSRQIILNLADGLQIIQTFGRDSDEKRAAGLALLRRAACEALLEGDRDILIAATGDIPPDERGGEQAAHDFVPPLRWSLASRGYLRPAKMRAALETVLPRVISLGAGILHLDWPVLVRRALCGPEQLAMAASRLHSTIGPGGRLVIYGLGRNGRAALKLVGERPRVAAIDDDPSRVGPVPRITVDDLTANDVVLITPDARGPILRRIDGTPARVNVPEDVLLGRGSEAERAGGT